MGKIRKNLIYETAYQLLNTCLPLITSPYLSRTLGVEQLGIYSYTTSLVGHFGLFAMLGTVGYGTRSITSVKKDRKELSRTFWGIYSLQVFTVLLALCAYLIFLLTRKENKVISLIQTLTLIDCLCNCSWLFFGLEEFQLTVKRGFVFRIITVILTITLVKKPEDLWIYALVMIGSSLTSNLLLWTHVPSRVSFEKPTRSEIKAHLRPNILLFIPILAMSVYHSMDKTMLGSLSTYTQSGYYYNADKIVNVMVGVVSGVSSVLMPRVTALITEGNREEADKLFEISLEGTVFAGSAIAFGIAAVANEFVPFFFGKGYDTCIILTVVLAPVLIIKAVSFTARLEYLIPHKREKEYIISIFIGAVIDLILNFILIPRLGAMGAVLGTLFAELGACIAQCWIVNRSINIRPTLLRCLIYMGFGLIMFCAVRLIARVSFGIMLKLLIEVMTGAIIYLILCWAYWKISGNDIMDIMIGPKLRHLFTR